MPEEVREQTIKKMIDYDCSQFFQLTREVEVERNALIEVQRRHEKKVSELTKKREALRKFEKAYFEHCGKNGKKPVSFSVFKRNREDRQHRK